MQFDLKSNIKVVKGLNPTSIGSNGVTNGLIIDTTGFNSATIIYNASSYTDGSFLPVIEEGENNLLADAVEISDDFLLGSEADATLTAEGITKIGSLGKKKYLRASVSASGVTSGATIDITVILGHPINNPVA